MNFLPCLATWSLEAPHQTFSMQFLFTNVGQSLSYAKEPLQESLGSTEINAGDATVAP